LAERSEFLRLKELVIQIARLVLEALAFADVANERFDAKSVAGRLGVRGDLHPHRCSIGATQSQQVVGNRAVALKPAEEAVARLRINEVFKLKRTNVGIGCLSNESKHQLQVRIRGKRPACVAVDGGDVHAFMD
jgi:hypothetical protein